MPASKFWTVRCIGILCAILLISIIIVWASKDWYREHNSNNVDNDKTPGDFVDWSDYVNVQSNFLYDQNSPGHVKDIDGGAELERGYTGTDHGFFLDSCGKCSSGKKCSKDCHDDAIDVSADPNNNRDANGKTATWKIVRTQKKAYKTQWEYHCEHSTSCWSDCCGNQLWPVYGDYIYLTQDPGVDGWDTGILRSCGDCHHHCSNCNHNILDVILHKDIEENGTSRWKILSAIGIPNGRRIKYGQPIHLRNGKPIPDSKLQARDTKEYYNRRTYLDTCGKCHQTNDSTNKCAGSDLCQKPSRRDVSTSFSPHRASQSSPERAGTGTWRFLPTNYKGSGWDL